MIRKVLLTVLRLRTICTKYHIPFEDLPEVLEEYIYADNEGWSD